MSPLSLAAGMFGLGAPELIVILIILLVLYSGMRSGRAISKPERQHALLDFSPQDNQMLFAVAAILVVAVGILIWNR